MEAITIPDFYPLFDEVILDRGSLIAAEGDIEWVLIDTNEIKAYVIGTYRYSVHIKWNDNDEFEIMDCSCPYEWTDYCKHLAAVLISLEEGFFIQDQIPEEITNEGQPSLKKLLKKAKKSELVAFILMLCETDSKLESKIRLLIHDEKPKKKTDYSALVKNYIDSNSDPEWGYLLWSATDEVYDFFYDLVNSLLEKEKYEDLVQLCPQIILQLNDHLMHVDDSRGSLSEAVIVAMDALAKIVEEDLIDTPTKNELVVNLFNVLQDDTIYDWDSGHYIWNILSELIDDEKDMQEFFKIMDKEVSNTEKFSKEYNKECMVNCQILLYQRLGYTDQALNITKENLDLKSVRKPEVDKAIANNEYEVARRLIRDGIEIARSNDHSGTVAEWDSILLKLALKEGNKETILNQALHNFYTHHSTLDLFVLIKEYTDPDEWINERNKIISAIKSRDHYYVDSIILQIYHHEKMWSELLESIQSYGADFYILDKYCDDLLQYDKDAVVKMYTLRIREFLETNKARKYYRVAARYIKKLKAMGAAFHSRELADELRKTYPRRTAMLEEFRGL